MLKKKCGTYVLMFAIVLLVIAPFAYTILFSLPSTDDFWMAAGVDRNNIFQEAVRVANDFYLNWGGGWIDIFTQVLCNPLLLFGTTSPMLGVELLLIFVTFIVTLWCVVREFANKVVPIFAEKLDIKWCFVCYLLILISILNANVWTEIFYWFVGASYLVAVILALWTVFFEIRFFTMHKIADMIVLSVVGFVACSNYIVAVFPGLFYLLFIIYEMYKKRKVVIKNVIPFGFFWLGAFWTLLAPGNYARHDVGGEGSLNLFKALFDTAILFADSLFNLIKNPIIVIVMVIFIGVGNILAQRIRIEFKKPIIPFGLSFFCLYIVYYPAALGYGGTSYLPNRIEFLYDIFGIIWFGISFIYMGGWLNKRKNIELSSNNMKLGVIALAVFGYICLFPTEYYQNVPYAKTVASVNRIKLANSEWKYLLNYIENLEETDVVCGRSVIEVPIIKPPVISADKEYRVNKYMAEYFGKDSVVVEWW